MSLLGHESFYCLRVIQSILLPGLACRLNVILGNVISHNIVNKLVSEASASYLASRSASNKESGTCMDKHWQQKVALRFVCFDLYRRTKSTLHA